MSSDKITDYDIQALVDGELNREESRRVKNVIESDPKAAYRYQELLDQKEMLGAWWKNRQFNS